MSNFTNRNKINLKIDSNEIDYKNVELLKKCITETGKIVPCRITGVTSRSQRLIAKSIKLARFLAFIPYCDQHQ